MNVFVLSTGRCGSESFAKACSHIDNYTAAHESRCSYLGDERLAFPDNHIEVDNRLSWFLGRLDAQYGDSAVYVYLYRDAQQVAESYNRRWTFYGSIAFAYTQGILKSKFLGIAPCHDYIRTVSENIEFFLQHKSHVLRINIADIDTEFESFWRTIDAAGNYNDAIAEFGKRHNASSGIEPATTSKEWLDPRDEQVHEMSDVLQLFRDEKETLLSKNRLLNRENKKNDASLAKLLTALTSEKEKNKELKSRLSAMQNTLSYLVIKTIKNDIRNPRKWIYLPVNIARVFYKKGYFSGFFTVVGKVFGNKANNDVSAAGLDLVPANITVEAAKHVANGSINKAIQILEETGEDRLLRVADLIRANRDIADEQKWLDHTNNYLAQYQLWPIQLIPGGASRFTRISAETCEVKNEGPLVSIIMPAFNAEATVAHAISSILNQSWRNLELVVVDDNSSDDTLRVIQQIADDDARVRVLSNDENVGPYVSKNRALTIIKGEFFTGQDADDWSHPQRIEKHVSRMLLDRTKKASLSFMLRLDESGMVARFSKRGVFSTDGVSNQASISCLFETAFFKDTFGHWDSVKYGADSEMISRARTVLGDRFDSFDSVGMLCCELEGSLTNDPVTGIGPVGLSPTRKQYKQSFVKWHSDLTADSAYLAFPQDKRKFSAPKDMQIIVGDKLAGQVFSEFEVK